MKTDVETYGDFTSLLENAGVIDNSYPVNGCYVWLPYGHAYKKRVFEAIEESFSDGGYEEYYFPRLLHGDSIRRVSDGIADFRDGLFWLQDFDGNDHDLFLNPTGECGVYTMLNRWINHESDLPKRLFQHGSTFRPHGNANAMLNGDELTDLVEAHSAFTTAEAARAEYDAIRDRLDRLHARLGIPVVRLERPKEGNNPVYKRMWSYETFLPSKQKSFNVGVLYDQQQIYSKVFDVEFSRQDGTTDHTYQVTFGLSERAVAAMLDLHRDEYGIRLLPAFAPTQVRIVPVYDGEHDDRVDEYAREIEGQLEDSLRVSIDDTDNNAGKRLAKGRLKGIPIRIGVSIENVADRSARVFIRTREAPLTEVDAATLPSELPDLLTEIRDTIVTEAREQFKERIERCVDQSELERAIADRHLAKIDWCGATDCLNHLNDSYSGELLGRDLSVRDEGTCIVCGERTENPAYFGIRTESP